MKNIIYGIVCPFTDEIRYIGKSTTGLRRPLEHLSKSHSKRVNEWVRELKELGFNPEIKVLEECTEVKLLNDKERFWIYKYIREKKPLLNVSLVTASMLLIDAPVEVFKNENELSTIIGFVKLMRKKRQLTQYDLAKEAKVGLRFIRDLEQGKISLRMDKVLDVLNVFGGKLFVRQTKNTD